MNAKAKRMDIRGIMLDPARQMEKHEFYFDLLPQLAEWGYNTLQWHFNDDEGFGIKLKSHPELATPYAFSKAETRRLVRAAADVGINVVPELETLGHARSITRLPQYAHLLNGSPIGHNAVCPSEPESLSLMADLIAEVADLFEGPYFHAGLDEARLVGCPKCTRRGKNKPPYWVFLQYVLEIHKLVTATGKRMIMWADPVEKNPGLLDELPKDIVLAHWHYRLEIPETKIITSTKKGFDVICVPAISGGTGLVRGYENPAAMVDLAGRLNPERSLGVVTSWWESGRVLRDTYPMAAAYAGEAMKKGKGAKAGLFAKRFVRGYFGCDNPALAHALLNLGLDYNRFKIFYPDSLTDIHDAIVLADSPETKGMAESADKQLAVLESARKNIKKHKSEFDAYLLSARIAAGAYRNASAIKKIYESYRLATNERDETFPLETVLASLDEALATMKALSDSVSSLATEASAEWDRTRYARDTKKDNSSPYMMKRSVLSFLAYLLHSKRFLENLSRAFDQALRDYRKGGPFPGF